MPDYRPTSPENPVLDAINRVSALNIENKRAEAAAENPLMRFMNQQLLQQQRTQEGRRKQLIPEQNAISKTAKDLGIPDMRTKMDSINTTLNDLTVNNNIGDNAAKFNDLLIALGPSARRAFGTALRSGGISPGNTAETFQSWKNKIMSSNDPTLNQSVRDSMIDFAKTQKDQLAKTYGMTKNKLAAALPTMTPAHQELGVDYNPYVATLTGPLEDSFKETDDIIGKLKAPPKTTQQFQQPQMKQQGFLEKLKGMFSFSPSPQVSSTPQQPAPQPQQPLPDFVKKELGQ